MKLGSHNRTLVKRRLMRLQAREMRFSGSVAGYRNATSELNMFNINYNVENMKQESRTLQDEVSQHGGRHRKWSVIKLNVVFCNTAAHKVECCQHAVIEMSGYAACIWFVDTPSPDLAGAQYEDTKFCFIQRGIITAERISHPLVTLGMELFRLS